MTMKNKRNPAIAELARIGGEAVKKAHPDHFSEMGKKGAEPRLRKYGPDYYSRIGKLGAAKRWAKKKKSKALLDILTKGKIGS